MSDARKITLREEHVALGELKSCKSTRAVYERKGDVYFLSDKKTAIKNTTDVIEKLSKQG